jgi:ribosome modulation factor
MNLKEKQSTEEFSRGWSARSNNKSLTDCPYTRATEEATLWCYGWHEASRDPALLSEEMALL